MKKEKEKRIKNKHIICDITRNIYTIVTNK